MAPGRQLPDGGLELMAPQWAGAAAGTWRTGSGPLQPGGGGHVLGQLGGRWLLKRGPGGPDGGAPGQSTLLQDPRPPALAKTVSPEPPSRPSISGFSFIFRQVPALLRACSAVSVAHTRGDTDETEEAEWAVGRLCRPAPESPCHGRRLHAVSAAWSPWLWRGLCVRDAISVSAAWPPWHWCGLRVSGVVPVAVAYSPWPQHGLCVHGMVVCPRCGLRGCGMVSVAVL